MVFSSPASSARRAASSTGSSAREIVPLIGRASTGAVAVDREEALRRGADDRALAEAQEGGERRRVAAAQAAVEGERVGAGVGRELVGEADLVGLARRQFGLRAFDVGEVALAAAAAAEADVGRRGSSAVGGPAAPRAGGARRASRRRLSSPADLRARRRPRRRSLAAEGEDVGAVARVVDGDDAVGEHQQRVGQVGAVDVGRAAVGLQLVAEVADVAADQAAVDARSAARPRARAISRSSRSKIEPCSTVARRPARGSSSRRRRRRRRGAARPARRSSPCRSTGRARSARRRSRARTTSSASAKSRS